MEHVIRTHIHKAGWLSAAGSVLALALLLPSVWMQRIRRRRELMGLLGQPDHLLKDVGLQRGDITREGLKPFWHA
jgi:uncharacterized protein YjiS (DUF1127 family)